jgi:glycogen(starch) synthase
VRSVLWLTQVFPRRLGDPFGHFLLRLAREMPARGWDVTVVAPGDDGAPAQEDLHGVHVVRFGVREAGAAGLAYHGEMHRAALRRPRALVRFLRAFRTAADEGAARTECALIHAHWWIPTGWIARGVAPRARRPWVVSFDGTDVRLVRRWPIVRPLAQSVLASASSVLPVSSSLDDEVAAWRVAADRREILPMPADADLFRPAAPTSPGAGAVRFAIVARLTRQKRVVDAIRAMVRLAATAPEVELDIVGDGPERAALERFVRRSALQARVTFHGMLPPANLPAIYQRARAVLLPSQHEGYGITVIEAALCGVPAIVARSGALPELVESDRTGLVVDVGDVGALARAMARLVEDRGLAGALGEAARAKAQARTAGPLADRLAAVYERVARPGGREIQSAMKRWITEREARRNGAGIGGWRYVLPKPSIRKPFISPSRSMFWIVHPYACPWRSAIRRTFQTGSFQ